jgi:hypothetical protein
VAAATVARDRAGPRISSAVHALDPVARAPHDQVLALHIAMHDADVMQGLQGREDIGHDPDRARRSEDAFQREHPRQRSAAHVLHRDPRQPLRHADVEDRDEVRVRRVPPAERLPRANARTPCVSSRPIRKPFAGSRQGTTSACAVAWFPGRDDVGPGMSLAWLVGEREVTHGDDA